MTGVSRGRQRGGLAPPWVTHLTAETTIPQRTHNGAHPRRRALVARVTGWARSTPTDEEGVGVDPSTPRVLVVDDDEAVRTLASWQLESDGFAVAQAGDGDEALSAIDTERPDLVVLDLSMPGLRGLDVLRRVRAAPVTEALPVIVLSGRSGETDRIVGLALGADDYRVKPF